MTNDVGLCLVIMTLYRGYTLVLSKTIRMITLKNMISVVIRGVLQLCTVDSPIIVYYNNFSRVHANSYNEN